MARQILHVNPTKGQDSERGESAGQPLRTLTEALRRSQGNTLILLQAGIYATSSGEKFPITIPSGCQVVGVSGSSRPATVIQGSGPLPGSSSGAQAVTCVLLGNATLQMVTLINTQNQGIGVWMADGRPQLQDVVILNCPQYGSVVLATAVPTIKTSVFENCGIAGIAFFAQSKGQLAQIICQKNNTGVLVQDSAAPLMLACRLEQNRMGMVITDTAYPVLRNSRLTYNQAYGLQVTGQGRVDLGQPQDPGNNIVRHNEQGDINNRSGRSLTSCGNDLLPQRLQGRVDLMTSDLPDLAAVPTSVLETAPSPSAPPPQPLPPERGQPPQGSKRFQDMVNHWAGAFVDGLVQAGGIVGFSDGTFRPDQRVTRAQFAAFVMASFSDRPTNQPPVQFTDIAQDFWAYDALLTAQRLGFMSGYPDGTIRPNEPITRIQGIVAVTNGLGLSGGRADDIGLYQDRAQVPSYAVDALATATQQRLVVNYPAMFRLRPLEAMTRAETSALIYQGRVVLGKSSALASPYLVQPNTTQPLFSDLSGHWAATFIQGLAQVNLVSGLRDGRFAPDAPMTRAQFAALAVRAFQPPVQRPGTVFRDVPADFWAADTIQAAYQGGFMSGFPDQTFGPNNPLVRVQTWIALVNGLNWGDISVNLNDLGRFADYTTLPRYAIRATAIAADQKIIASHPDPTRLQPNQVATRAGVCATVYQALVALQRLPAIASPAIV